jgi:hypothetical protein
MTEPNKRDWRELCGAVEKEKDSKEFDRLLEELILALDDGQRSPGFPDSAWKRGRVQ